MAPSTGLNGSSVACAHEGQFCEYGDDFDPTCNTLVACIDGVWGTPNVGISQRMCGSTVAPAAPENPGACVATRTSIVNGEICTGDSTCAYDDSNCTCGHYCPQYPVSFPICDSDSGLGQTCCDVSGPPSWHCFDGPPYCASNRPSVGDPCTQAGATCAITAATECGQTTLACTNGLWQLDISECPISTARAKRDIRYLGPEDLQRLHDALLGVKLATYKYKLADPSQHLGFIIEDMPDGSPAVLASRERVDLYGYLSMTVAAIQQQQAQIDALEKRLASAEHEPRQPKRSSEMGSTAAAGSGSMRATTVVEINAARHLSLK